LGGRIGTNLIDASATGTAGGTGTLPIHFEAKGSQTPVLGGGIVEVGILLDPNSEFDLGVRGGVVTVTKHDVGGVAELAFGWLFF
jgi:hypothetical protein